LRTNTYQQQSKKTFKVRFTHLTLFWLSFLTGSLSFALPRLVVVVVVDQMRADYLHHPNISWNYGVKTIINEGLIFEKARYQHVPTDTASGHAVIMTGANPVTTGIIGNQWWDSKNKGMVSAVINEKGELGPFHLEVPGLGDRLISRSPKSKVIAVSQKDRSAILLGGKKPTKVIWFDAKQQKFVTYFSSPLPEWASHFNMSLPPEWESPFLTSSGKRGASYLRDKVLLDVMLMAMKAEALGKDEDPDLLAISFSETDAIGHRYGPFSLESDKHLREIDEILGQLLKEINSWMKGGEFVVILTSDHGVLPLPESPLGKQLGLRRIEPKEFHSQVETTLIESATDELKLNKAQQNIFVEKISLPYVYLNHVLIGDDSERHALFEKLRKQLKMLEFISEIYWRDQQGVTDVFSDMAQASFHKRSGDLILRLKEGVLVQSRELGGTNHGSFYFYDSKVPVIFYGPSIKKGINRDPFFMTDLARHMARLLGLP